MNDLQEEFDRRRSEDHWHFSRSIPISVLGVVFVQSIVVIWWLAGLAHKVEGQGERTKEISSQLNVVSSSITTSSAQLTINTVEIAAIKSQISELRSRLDSVQAEQARRSTLFPLDKIK